MSWIPPNLATLCSSHSTVSTCQQPTFMFLTLVAHLFGRSKDRPYYHSFRHVEESARSTPELLFSYNVENSPIDETYSYQFPTKLDESRVVQARKGRSTVNFEGIYDFSPRTRPISALAAVYDDFKRGKRIDRRVYVLRAFLFEISSLESFTFLGLKQPLFFLA